MRSFVSTAWSCMGLVFLLQCNKQRFIRQPSKVSAVSLSFHTSSKIFKILSLHCFYCRCIWENRDQIRTKLHTGNRVQNTYNYSLEGRRYADIVEQVHSDITTHKKTRFKINYSYGVILRNVGTDQLRYFYESLGNARMLDFAVLISDQDDRRHFLEEICDFDMKEKIERHDTKFVLVTVSDIIFFVSLLPNIPIGGGLNYPPSLSTTNGFTLWSKVAIVVCMTTTCACFVAWLCSVGNRFNVVNTQPMRNFTSTAMNGH